MSRDRRADPVYAREHAEPVERNNPVPWLLGLIAACLCVWGVSYFLLNQSLAPATALPSKSVAATPQAPRPPLQPTALRFLPAAGILPSNDGAGLPGVPPLADPNG
jgi:hypothetical protein